MQQINTTRRGFLGLIAAAGAAIALRKAVTLQAANSLFAIGEPAEPLVAPIIFGFDDASTFRMLKELYADDIFFMSGASSALAWDSKSADKIDEDDLETLIERHGQSRLSLTS